jgi:Mrp family chromosome partitioning ATPase
VARFRRRRQAENDTVGPPPKPLVTLLDPSGVASEAYRSLRTSLLYAAVDAPPTVILITSPGSRDGKSTTCANLGVALAQAGKRTLIIDGDLREPSVHKFFDVPNVSGVVDVLAGQYELLEVCKEPVPGLHIISAGPIPPSPGELLGSGRVWGRRGGARGGCVYLLFYCSLWTLKELARVHCVRPCAILEPSELTLWAR